MNNQINISGMRGQVKKEAKKEAAFLKKSGAKNFY
jgi:hypothetical protein